MQGAGNGVQRRILAILVVLLLAYGVAASGTVQATSNSSSGDSSAATVLEAEPTLSWIKQHGGQVNVIVRSTPDSGRAVFAPQAFKKGGILASIPFHLVYQASTDASADVQFTALKFLEDLADSNHSHQKYFVSLPPRNGVWSLHDLPKTYIPLIQSKDGALEEAITDFQERLHQLWDKVNTAKPLPGTIEDLKYATAQLLTRLHQYPGVGLLMIPLLDMGNHRNDCSNTHLIETCPSAPDKQCVVWRAGRDIAEGNEVCNFYKYMFNDRSLLQYGFLQSGAVAQRLSGIDRHDFNTTQPWQDTPSGDHGPMLFEGTPAEVTEEIKRLAELRTALQASDLIMKGLKADPTDSGGWILTQLWQWRQQRQQAIDKELRRLQRQLTRLEQQTAGQSDLAGYGTSHVSKRLTDWLEQSGAQVNVELRRVSTASSASSLISRPSPDKAGSYTATTLTAPTLTAEPTCTNNGNTQICVSGLLNETTSSNEHEDTEANTVQVTRTGVFAKSAVKAGDTLAVIPMQLTRQIREGNAGFLESVVDLLLSASNLSHRAPFKDSETLASVQNKLLNVSSDLPFIAALHNLGTAHGLHNFPQQYLPLINSKPMENHIMALQAMLWKGWDSNRPMIEAADDSLTFKELQHIASLVSTRSLAYEEGLLLVPLLSMTSAHLNNGCGHYDYIDKCPNSDADASKLAADNRCIYWVAGSDVAADEEVCLFQNYLSPDHSVLQYGAIQQQEASAGLHAMDRHDFDPEQPCSAVNDQPEPFSGTKEAVLGQAARLSLLLDDLSSKQALYDLQRQPVSSDPHGQLLQNLHWLAQHRIEEVQSEIERLSKRYELSDSELKETIEQLVNEQMGHLQQGGQEAGSSAPEVHVGVTGSDPWDNMLDWMRNHGGTVNTEISYVSPTSGRVVVAGQDLRRGDMIAAIPLQLMFPLRPHGSNDTYELAAANLWDAMNDLRHPLRPYFQALPFRDELICPLVDMPDAYIPLLNNDIAESGVLEYQQRITAFWEDYKGQLREEIPNMTIGDLKYARALIATRIFAHTTLGDVLIPLLDMANHQEDCPHIQTLGPCPSDLSQDCMLWHAGATLARGDEVCNFYKTMLNDQTFLQYGFLQASDKRLHNVDRHDFVDAASFWAPNSTDSAKGDSRKGAVLEVQRLQTTAAALRKAVLQGVAPDQGTTGFGTLVHDWLKLRLDAIAEEIGRLQNLFGTQPESRAGLL